MWELFQGWRPHNKSKAPWARAPAPSIRTAALGLHPFGKHQQRSKLSPGDSEAIFCTFRNTIPFIMRREGTHEHCIGCWPLREQYSGHLTRAR